MENIKKVKDKVDKIATSINSIQNDSGVVNHVKLIKEIVESDDIKTLADGVITIYSVVDTENKLIKKSLKELTHNLVDLHHEHLILIIELKEDLNKISISKKTPNKSKNFTEAVVNNPIKSVMLIVFALLTIFGGLMGFYKIDKEAFTQTTKTIEILKGEGK